MSSQFKMPDGATFTGVLAGLPEDHWLLSTDAGYGFVARHGSLQSRGKAGKAALTVPEGAKVLPPVAVPNPETDKVVVATQQGRLLVFPASELPQLAKGKGVKLINVKPADFKSAMSSLIFLGMIDDTAMILPCQEREKHGEKRKGGHALSE